MPPARPAEGITLTADPDRTIPQTTLTPARGSSLRESTAGSSVTSLPSAKVRSEVRCGREVWPPLPLSSTSRWSAAPVSGPSRSPTVPTSRPGSACRPKMRETPSRTPASIAISAPPGMISSAGWKISRTRPGSESATAARDSPAPSRAAACTSWPQACATPVTVLAQGSSVRSSTGSASRSARRATTGPSPDPMSTTSPLRGSGTGLSPASSRRLASSVEVRSSAHESSGCACRSRRTSISCSDSAATRASTTGSRRSRSGPGPGIGAGAAEVTRIKPIRSDPCFPDGTRRCDPGRAGTVRRCGRPATGPR